ncbi:MAG: EF-P lysine aminoacylase EpmA [Rhodospirillaceae bacterium]
MDTSKPPPPSPPERAAPAPAAVPAPWWRPDVFARRRANLAARTAALRAVREFFDARGYVEVETPALQVSPGMEPHLEAFATTLFGVAGEGSPVGLHTSPEFAMKKLLAAGMERIWQLARVFRNGERSARHHPEFTMLEWYAAGAGWRDIARETEDLVRAVAGPVARHRGHEVDLAGPWEYLSFADAFARHAGIDLLATAPDGRDGQAPDRDALARRAREIGIRTADDDAWDDIVFRILFEKIEPHLGFDAPTVFHSWPVSMAALARPDPADPRVADRFEVFVCGLELANGYGELTDAAEQRRRFAAEVARREGLGRAAWPVDADFIAALESGLPDCGGVALGFDRLVMLATGADRIEDVLWAPVAEPVAEPVAGGQEG